MPNKKEQNARMLDPQRFQVAKSMAVMPGGPMNNNPMNVSSVDPNNGSMSGINQYPYGDSGLENAPQMGTNAVYPMPNSGLQQNMPVGTKMNAAAPYGMQPQPDSQSADLLESMRLGSEAKAQGLVATPMGVLGLPTTVAPGGSVPSPQQSPMTMPLQGMPSAEAAAGGGINMKSGKRSKGKK